jgi:hypothetical protein
MAAVTRPVKLRLRALAQENESSFTLAGEAAP